MKKYTVTLTQEVPDKNLDQLDIGQFGKHGKGKIAYEWVCKAANSADAIDKFHKAVPVACVDNYAWDAEQERSPTSGSVQLHGYVVHHKHGEDVLMGCTPEESKQYLYDYVCQWWDELDRVDEDGEDVPVPEDQDEAISEYFDSENGAYEEYAEETSPIVDPTYGMEVFITSDSLQAKHTLNIRFTSEGMIFDYVDDKGEVVKTMSKMYNEIVEDWML